MVDNISKNTVSEILARKHLNALNETKNAEIKNKCLISKQKELLDLFNNLLDTILIENKNTTTTNNNDYNENENESENENENDNDNENVIKGLNNCLDEIIDKTKSFEEQEK